MLSRRRTNWNVWPNPTDKHKKWRRLLYSFFVPLYKTWKYRLAWTTIPLTSSRQFFRIFFGKNKILANRKRNWESTVGPCKKSKMLLKIMKRNFIFWSSRRFHDFKNINTNLENMYESFWSPRLDNFFYHGIFIHTFKGGLHLFEGNLNWLSLVCVNKKYLKNEQLNSIWKLLPADDQCVS